MYRIEINQWCKECGVCAAYCPKKVFEHHPGSRPAVVNEKDCVNCGMCERRCPDLAITVKEASA